MKHTFILSPKVESYDYFTKEPLNWYKYQVPTFGLVEKNFWSRGCEEQPFTISWINNVGLELESNRLESNYGTENWNEAATKIATWNLLYSKTWYVISFEFSFLTFLTWIKTLLIFWND